MAGDWIKFEVTTLDKPEVCQIADMADIDIDAVVGKLLRVWGWFDQQTEKGNAPSVTKKLLNRLVGVNNFCECMVAVGWMDDDGKSISLPNFCRHNGKTAKNRALTAKRVASHKVVTASANAKGNAGSVSDPVETALPKEEKILNPSLSQGAACGMPLDWVPPDRLLATYAKTSGVPLELFTAEAIGPFIVHHNAKGTIKTEAEFVSGLVNWVKRDKLNAQRVVQFPNAKPADPNVDDTRWAEGLEL